MTKSKVEKDLDEEDEMEEAECANNNCAERKDKVEG